MENMETKTQHSIDNFNRFSYGIALPYTGLTQDSRAVGLFFRTAQGKEIYPTFRYNQIEQEVEVFYKYYLSGSRRRYWKAETWVDDLLYKSNTGKRMVYNLILPFEWEGRENKDFFECMMFEFDVHRFDAELRWHDYRRFMYYSPSGFLYMYTPEMEEHGKVLYTKSKKQEWRPTKLVHCSFFTTLTEYYVLIHRTDCPLTTPQLIHKIPQEDFEKLFEDKAEQYSNLSFSDLANMDLPDVYEFEQKVKSLMF